VFGRQASITGDFGISVADFVNPSNDYCEQAIPLLPDGAEVLGTTVNAMIPRGQILVVAS